MGEGKEVVSLENLSKKMDDFAKARDWEKYHSPRNLLLAMEQVEETYIMVKPDGIQRGLVRSSSKALTKLSKNKRVSSSAITNHLVSLLAMLNDSWSD
ncbi:unnamed protein product [Eruca vesicaria subsp. sativa]|uniref:Nucleoside diphosphate kinase n=1 Tax=Eruca vesicaria subsp. sativa TaxID=29727 RepID=A0ABC8M5H8_ERUVS|nr:unnamed protein product [Eruca vesicaria subsp. sativa]